MLYDFFCPVQLHMFRSAITSYRVPSVPARPSNQPMQIQYKALQEHVRQQILYINVKGTHTACSDAAMQHAVMTKAKTLVFHTCFASLSSIHVSHPCLQCLSSKENSWKFLEMLEYLHKSCRPFKAKFGLTHNFIFSFQCSL